MTYEARQAQTGPTQVQETVHLHCLPQTTKMGRGFAKPNEDPGKLQAVSAAFGALNDTDLGTGIMLSWENMKNSLL